MSDVWLKVAQFLGSLNGENVGRDSYVHIPEYEEALAAWKDGEKEWRQFLEAISPEQRITAEEMNVESITMVYRGSLTKKYVSFGRMKNWLV